ATSAEYSPKLCPATNDGALIPSSIIARNAATETVKIAGCVFSVNCKSSAGPSKQSREIAKPNASSASSKTRRATGNFSAKSFPIPGLCEPCPGKIIANCRLPIKLIADCRLPIADCRFSLNAPNKLAIGNRQLAMPLPSEQYRAPRSTATKRSHQHEIARFDSPCFDTFVERNRN